MLCYVWDLGNRAMGCWQRLRVRTTGIGIYDGYVLVEAYDVPWFQLLRYPFLSVFSKESLVYRKDTVFAHFWSFWGELWSPCTCTKAHTRLVDSLTAAASAYPDKCCEEAAIIAVLEFPGADGPWVFVR